MKTEDDIITNCFARVVGQERIVSQLVRSCKAAAQGGELSSVLLEGQAGLGKTMLWHAYLDGLNAAYIILSKAQDPVEQSLRYSSPNEFRRAGDEYSTLVSSLNSMRPLFLGIDEMSDFRDRKTVQTEKIHQFIKKALDDNGYGESRRKTVRFDEDLAIEVSRHQFAVVAATNFPEKMVDADAMRSRFTRLVLDLLTSDELTKIFLQMLHSRNIRADERTVNIVAKTGRGTARVFEKILKYFEDLILAENKKTRTINRDEVVVAMRELQLYPAGLTRPEVSMLVRCREGDGYRAASLALMHGLEIKGVSKSIAFLQSLNFIHVRGSNVVTSSRGLDYLQALKEDKFQIPA